MRTRLAAAGYRWHSAGAMFNGVRWSSAALFSVLALWLTFANRDAAGSLVAVLCAACFGYLVPDRVLCALVKARSRRLRSALPAALDLMVLGLEAGQSLDQSIEDTARELRHAHPDLSTEFALLQFEMQLGKSRAEALNNLSERNTEPEIRRFAALILEGDRFGVSVAPTLASNSKHLRNRMRQQAYEQARKLSVKLVFPVFFLIMPALMLVTLGPAVIQLMNQLDVLMAMP